MLFLLTQDCVVFEDRLNVLNAEERKFTLPRVIERPVDDAAVVHGISVTLSVPPADAWIADTFSPGMTLMYSGQLAGT